VGVLVTGWCTEHTAVAHTRVVVSVVAMMRWMVTITNKFTALLDINQLAPIEYDHLAVNELVKKQHDFTVRFVYHATLPLFIF
jgi:hypothetical protein